MCFELHGVILKRTCPGLGWHLPIWCSPAQILAGRPFIIFSFTLYFTRSVSPEWLLARHLLLSGPWLLDIHFLPLSSCRFCSTLSSITGPPLNSRFASFKSSVVDVWVKNVLPSIPLPLNDTHTHRYMQPNLVCKNPSRQKGITVFALILLFSSKLQLKWNTPCLFSLTTTQGFTVSCSPTFHKARPRCKVGRKILAENWSTSQWVNPHIC